MFLKSGNQKKKLVIVPFKNAPLVPDDFQDVSWSKLKSAVRAVYNNVSVPISREELYQIVESLCIQKHSMSLYDNLSTECEYYATAKVDSLLVDNIDNHAFLHCVDNVWKNHCDHTSTIRNIFLYLDRSFAFQTNNVRSIWSLGLHFFRTRFNFYPDLQSKLVKTILQIIDAERQGHFVERDTLRRLLDMLYSLGLYTDKFESVLLSESQMFFRLEGQIMIENADCVSFLLHVERRLLEVHEMVANYLDVSTRQPLIEVIESEMLKPYASLIIERGLFLLIESGRHRILDLKRMYGLLSRVSKLDALLSGFAAYIRNIGEGIVLDVNREKTLVDDLLELHDRLNVVLAMSFSNNPSFRFSLKSSFEHVINKRHNKPAELLVKYADKKLRGEKGLSERETENILDQVMVLFRYLQDKDVFEAFYKNYLSKRLLLGKSSSVDLEKGMLTKLKSECGSNYTSKLEGMFQDIELSREIMLQYSTSLLDEQKSSQKSTETNKKPSVECHFQVLTTGFWPSQVSIQVKIPLELNYHKEKFQNFYSNRYQGRRLSWNHILDRCIVTSHFPKGKKELELSFVQTVVLMSFDSSSYIHKIGFSVLQIQEITNIESGELRRTLLSLACGVIGTRVLNKVPMSKDINGSDKFFVDNDFTNKQFRIKINTIQLRESAEETDRTNEVVFQDRQYQVDAVVVRIMKSRRRLTHNTLVAEIITQLKFPVKPVDIKKRIESLIEREYLQRDLDDSTVYNYVA